MPRYKVLASDPHSAVLALVDDTGRCHVGRATTAAPPPGAVLVGEAPAVGLRLLKLVDNDAPCPVALALIDCDPVLAVQVATPL